MGRKSEAVANGVQSEPTMPSMMAESARAPAPAMTMPMPMMLPQIWDGRNRGWQGYWGLRTWWVRKEKGRGARKVRHGTERRTPRHAQAHFERLPPLEVGDEYAVDPAARHGAEEDEDNLSVVVEGGGERQSVRRAAGVGERRSKPRCRTRATSGTPAKRPTQRVNMAMRSQRTRSRRRVRGMPAT